MRGRYPQYRSPAAYRDFVGVGNLAERASEEWRTRRTAPGSRLAQERGISWFERNVITRVPLPNRGAMREVYPGFLQLTGFMTMNLDRHMSAHRELYWHLVEGDGQSAAKQIGRAHV